MNVLVSKYQRLLTAVSTHFIRSLSSKITSAGACNLHRRSKGYGQIYFDASTH